MTHESSSPGSQSGTSPSASSALDSLLDAVERIRPIIEEHAAQSEAQRALAAPVYDAMRDAGLFRTLAPKTFGGLELHPTEAYQVWEAVARIDSAAAWNLQISSAISTFASRLPTEGGKEAFERGPDTIFAGGFFPPGLAVRVNGGWRVTARTPFASGCNRAHWFVVPIVEVDDQSSKFDPTREDPPSIITYIPRDEIDLVDTWHTVGMRGTFSADVSVDDVFVPDHRVAYLEEHTDPAPAFAGPLYGTTPWPGIHGETIVSLGIAGAAIDKLVDLAARKTPGSSRIALRDREMAQHHAGKARALVDASRDSLHAAISEAYRDAERDRVLSEATKMRCQLAACFGAEACVQAVDLVCEAAGTTAIRIEHGIERHHRDVHVLARHADKAYSRYEDVGRMMFGLPPSFFTLKL
jgi:alkylation response protein AidB-like acyl-CoA dehydrogenase